ncbi:hypothetical protein [Streptosporangium sp. V21-05]|uniref:hypothetical protein n=1 Tax=Streptosporangium sp. V21-05 TaxID=3446115 RepID=UPI003F53C7CA
MPVITNGTPAGTASGRAAAAVVALCLAVVAVTAVLAVVVGEVSALSVVATATTWARPMRGAEVVPLLAGICGLNAWALWQVLRGPALPRAEGSPRGSDRDESPAQPPPDSPR